VKQNAIRASAIMQGYILVFKDPAYKQLLKEDSTKKGSAKAHEQLAKQETQ
jgi:hypothetical protein